MKSQSRLSSLFVLIRTSEVFIFLWTYIDVLLNDSALSLKLNLCSLITIYRPCELLKQLKKAIHVLCCLITNSANLKIDFESKSYAISHRSLILFLSVFFGCSLLCHFLTNQFFVPNNGYIISLVSFHLRHPSRFHSTVEIYRLIARITNFTFLIIAYKLIGLL